MVPRVYQWWKGIKNVCKAKKTKQIHLLNDAKELVISLICGIFKACWMLIRF